MLHFRKTQPDRLFSMTWPIVLELLLTGFINTGSTYLLNRYSQDAVAVVGSLSQIVTLTVNLYTIISVGGQRSSGTNDWSRKKQRSRKTDTDDSAF